MYFFVGRVGGLETNSFLYCFVQYNYGILGGGRFFFGEKFIYYIYIYIYIAIYKNMYIIYISTYTYIYIYIYIDTYV